MKGFNQSGFVALAFILVGLIAIPGLAADKSKEEQTWFAERVTSGDTGFSLERFWSRGSLFRSEAVLGGQPMTTIVNETHYLMIDVLLARGISIERSARAKAKDKERGRPFALEAEKMIEDGGEQVSEEKYGLGTCLLFRTTDNIGKREVCISDLETKLPIFLRTWHLESNKNVNMRYLNWSRALEMDDTFFKPDPRVKLEEFTYDAYQKRVAEMPTAPFPLFHPLLLHGSEN